MGDVFTDGRQGRVRLGQGRTSTRPTCPRSSRGKQFEKKGYVVVPFPDDHMCTPAMRWFAEGRKRDTPDWGPHPGDTVGFNGLQTSSGKIEFVARRSRTSRPTASSIPNGRRWARSSSPAGRGITPRSSTTSTRCRWSSPTRASASTPWATPRDWLNEVKDHRILHRDGHRYWIMRLNTKDAKPRGASRKATSSARSTTAASSSLPPRSRNACRRARYTRTRRAPTTCRLGEPGYSTDTAGCINILHQHADSSHRRPPAWPTTRLCFRWRNGRVKLDPSFRRRPT